MLFERNNERRNGCVRQGDRAAFARYLLPCAALLALVGCSSTGVPTRGSSSGVATLESDLVESVTDLYTQRGTLCFTDAVNYTTKISQPDPIGWLNVDSPRSTAVLGGTGVGSAGSLPLASTAVHFSVRAMDPSWDKPSYGTRRQMCALMSDRRVCWHADGGWSISDGTGNVTNTYPAGTLPALEVGPPYSIMQYGRVYENDEFGVTFYKNGVGVGGLYSSDFAHNWPDNYAGFVNERLTVRVTVTGSEDPCPGSDYCDTQSSFTVKPLKHLPEAAQLPSGALDCKYDGLAPVGLPPQTLRMALVALRFADAPVIPYSPNDYASALIGGGYSLRSYLKEVSRGREDLEVDVFAASDGDFIELKAADSTPLDILDACPSVMTSSNVAPGYGYPGDCGLWDEVRVAAATAGLQASQYDAVTYLVHGLFAAGYGGGGEILMGTSSNFPDGSKLVGTLAHELGHGTRYGASYDAYEWSCPVGDPLVGRDLSNMTLDRYHQYNKCKTSSYADRFDAMGGASVAKRFHGEHLALAGWLDAPETVASPATGTSVNTYSLGRLHSSAYPVKMLRIPLSTGNYFVEYRTDEGFDSPDNGTYRYYITDPVVPMTQYHSARGVHLRYWNPSTRTSYTVWPQSYRADRPEAAAPMQTGHSFCDPYRGITVSVDGFSSDGDSATVRVVRGPCCDPSGVCGP